MPAPLRITVSDEENRTLAELRLATTVPQRTRDRAHMLRLNAQGWTAPTIAEIFECHEHTGRATIRRWQKLGLGGLGKQDPEQRQLKQSDLKTLKLADLEGHLELKYLDESGCCLWSPVSYSYSRIGEQKRIEQTQRRQERRFLGPAHCKFQVAMRSDGGSIRLLRIQ